MLQSPDFPAVIRLGPTRSRVWVGLREDDPAPASWRKVTVHPAQVRRLRGAEAGVVEAAKERDEPATIANDVRDYRQDRLDLGGVGDDTAVNGLADLRRLPLDLIEGL